MDQNNWMENGKEIIFAQLNKADTILIWGTGYHTEEVLRFYKSFLDTKQVWITDTYKFGGTIAGHPILPPGETNFQDVDLVVIMSYLFYGDIEKTLRTKYDYQGYTMELTLFRRTLSLLDDSEGCRCHLEDFIRHMEEGIPSYSYDSIFEEKFKRYRTIKVFAWWVASIGESIRSLLAFYVDAFQNKAEDEYYLLIPFISGNDFANGKLIEMVSRNIPVVTYENCHFWSYVFKKYPERFTCNSYNDYNNVYENFKSYLDADAFDYCLIDRKFSVISYTREEEREAAERLKMMVGTRKFVCIFARDEGYHLSHTLFDQSIRNSSITSFEGAVAYLAEKDIRAIRMGKSMGKAVDMFNCIDYAVEYQNDLMDIYLYGKCKFCIGNMSGILNLALLQDAPALMIGVVQIGSCSSLNYKNDDIYIPKKIYSKREKRFLNFIEMWDAEMAAIEEMGHYYQNQKLKFIECSQEEIREATMELNDKIDGTYVEDDQEKELQRRYHALLDDWIEKHGYRYSYFLHCNISGSFIKKNVFLLEGLVV